MIPSHPSLKLKAPLQGRYIRPEHIEQWISVSSLDWKVMGLSEENRAIYALKWGRGSTKVMMWSQMHGNESTTTRALADLIQNLESAGSNHHWFEQFSFLLLPQLNPDGAERFTRVNANQVDLNRDAIEQSQKESRVLRTCFEEFEPDYCFNLHDQRSIFGAGTSGEPAQVSFLAPAADPDKVKTPSRTVSAHLIVAMRDALYTVIGNQVGRYDDQFNGNCVGDYFQSKGVPTILFEAGHAGEDYQREECRGLIAYSLVHCLDHIQKLSPDLDWPASYDLIPENEKNFMDGVIVDGTERMGFQYREEVFNGQLHFIPEKVAADCAAPFFHRELNTNRPEDQKAIEEVLTQLKK